MFIVVSRSAPGLVALQSLTDDGTVDEHAVTLPADRLPAAVSEREAKRPRWVWDDTRRWYPGLLARGVRVERCVDLRLSHAILRNSALTAASALARAEEGAWDTPIDPGKTPEQGMALFELDDERSDRPADALLAEFALQRAAVAASSDTGRIRLLLAAESVGALIAVELHSAGLPWRADVHARLLTELTGPRTGPGVRPVRLEELADGIRRELDARDLNPDSPADVLRALNRAGLLVNSTRSWELKKLEHPVVEPLLRYKKLSRLLTANGWAWMDAWVSEGRFRAEYVPGGVVTGRWAARGGGALQLPRQVRGAVVADDGWRLVVADAAQLEPRILAGLAQDGDMAAAGAGKDLYAGIVESGAVDDRAHAKVAMLGAMYGATTGDSGRLMPRLARAFPRAIGLVEEAARAGERGEVVTSRLGRSSPRPPEGWRRSQALASESSATAADERTARSQAREWGRFTRNFIVQASAAEWALCWMAELRKRLHALVPEGRPADAVLADGPHLVYFLHDEVIVHTPASLAERVQQEIVASAVAAGGLLFGNFPVEYPVTAVVVDNYAQAQ